jgi:DNA repair protein RAD50
LKHTADAHNSLLNLQEQCEKEIDVLDENIREETYKLNKIDIVVPSELPRDDDEDGDQLSKVIESMMQIGRKKNKTVVSRLDKAKDDIVNTQKILAEKSALLAGNQKNLTSIRARLSTLTRSMVDVQQTVEELREYESRRGSTLSFNVDTPRELIKCIDDRLDELDVDNSPDEFLSKVSRRILKKLKKMVRYEPSDE